MHSHLVKCSSGRRGSQANFSMKSMRPKKDKGKKLGEEGWCIYSHCCWLECTPQASYGSCSSARASMDPSLSSLPSVLSRVSFPHGCLTNYMPGTQAGERMSASSLPTPWESTPLTDQQLCCR